MVQKTLLSGDSPHNNADTGKVSNQGQTPYDLFAQGQFGSYSDYTRVF